ncbi:MAG: DUF4384 domain-containing protein [Smithellaceae bacterium]|jgi:hypothetical protein|nr:DUF4384 domain-containing protein [Smithellaceae bacterium]HCX02278.1 hypothetical protein [Syntrophaceae bacterium]
MMRKLFVLLILVIFPLISLAAEKPVWVTAEGEALQGEFDTLKEIKGRARRDAQNKAVEMAVGTFIKSHTLVSNSQVAEDLIYAAVRGKITKEKILFSDWDAQERNLYKIRIKALVEPVYPEKGEGLSVKLSLSKSDLREGDEVKIFYTVSEDAYVYIFSVAADGSVTLLLPNAHLADNFVRANQAGQFPPAGNPISLKAMFLPGYEGKTAEERIKIIATKKKEPLLSLGFQEGLFQVYNEKSTGMIGDLVRRLNAIDPSDWAQAVAVYQLKK